MQQLCRELTLLTLTEKATAGHPHFEHDKPQKGLHILRHTFAVNCLNQGVPINIVKELLGHSSILTTMTYLRVVPIDLRVFLSRVEF